MSPEETWVYSKDVLHKKYLNNLNTSLQFFLLPKTNPNPAFLELSDHAIYTYKHQITTMNQIEIPKKLYKHFHSL